MQTYYGPTIRRQKLVHDIEVIVILRTLYNVCFPQAYLCGNIRKVCLQYVFHRYLMFYHSIPLENILQSLFTLYFLLVSNVLTLD